MVVDGWEMKKKILDVEKFHISIQFLYSQTIYIQLYTET